MPNGLENELDIIHLACFFQFCVFKVYHITFRVKYRVEFQKIRKMVFHVSFLKIIYIVFLWLVPCFRYILGLRQLYFITMLAVGMLTMLYGI